MVIVAAIVVFDAVNVVALANFPDAVFVVKVLKGR